MNICMTTHKIDKEIHYELNAKLGFDLFSLMCDTIDSSIQRKSIPDTDIIFKGKICDK